MPSGQARLNDFGMPWRTPQGCLGLLRTLGCGRVCVRRLLRLLAVAHAGLVMCPAFGVATSHSDLILAFHSSSTSLNSTHLSSVTCFPLLLASHSLSFSSFRLHAPFYNSLAASLPSLVAVSANLTRPDAPCFVKLSATTLLCPVFHCADLSIPAAPERRPSSPHVPRP